MIQLLRKALLILCANVIFNISLLAQNAFDIIPDVGGVEGQAQSWTLLPDSSWFYVLGDLLDTSINGYATILPWIGKANYEGQAFEARWIIDSPPDRPFRVARNSIYKNSQGNIIIYGSQRFSECCNHPKLIEVDPITGEILKSHYFNNPVDSSLGLTRDLFLNNDSLLIVSSYYWINSQYNAHISFLDQSFNLLNSFTINDNIYNNIVYYLEMDTDSTLVLIGDSRLASDHSDFPEVKPFYMRVSTDGQVLTFKRLTATTEKTLAFGLAYANTVTKDELNNWIISCLSIVETNLCQFCFYHVPYTLSISDDFDKINWITKFESFSPNKNEQPLVTSIVNSVDNSGFITSGFNDYSFLYKVNNQGDSIWLRKYIPLNWNENRALWTEFVDLTTTPYNSYLLTGRVSDNDLHIIRPWIIQLDSFGCLVPGCQTLVGDKDLKIYSENLFSIYPNPSSGYLYISNHFNGSLECELTLSSIDGQVIKTAQFYSTPGSEYFLPLDNLSSGVYLVNIVEKGKGKIGSNKIILQRD